MQSKILQNVRLVYSIFLISREIADADSRTSQVLQCRAAIFERFLHRIEVWNRRRFLREADHEAEPKRYAASTRFVDRYSNAKGRRPVKAANHRLIFSTKTWQRVVFRYHLLPLLPARFRRQYFKMAKWYISKKWYLY